MRRSLNESAVASRHLQILAALTRSVAVTDSSTPERALLTIRRIWQALASVHEPGVVQLLRGHPSYRWLRGELSAAWRQALFVLERATSIAILEADTAGEPAGSLLALEEYGQRDREYDLVSGQHFQRICMVGCGPYPETLFSLCERNLAPAGAIAGVDLSAEATSLAGRVLERQCRHLPADTFVMVTGDGATVNFAPFDLIVIANATRSKAQVIEQIALTAAPGTTLLLRNPRLMGEWLYETAAVSEGWRRLRSAQSSPLSASLLLRRD